MKSINKLGFTLVEMAIVLIIIGLLVGGIMGGQQLIKSSKASAIITEVAYYRNAMESFREKYKYLPGDVPEPGVSRYFTGYANPNNIPSSTPVLGNGRIDDGSSTNFEKDAFWMQLSYTGLIKDKIEFDPYAAAAVHRDPPTYRPATTTFKPGGYTFLDKVLEVNDTGHRAFSHVLRLGASDSGSLSQDLPKAVVPIDVARMIDGKADQPETPLSGTFFVDSDCTDLTNYRTDETLFCVLGFAEKDFGDVP